jgi:hypothetical protein
MNSLKTFHVQVLARLDIEVVASDAASARVSVDQSFRKDAPVDPLNGANIRLDGLHRGILYRNFAIARVLGAVAQAPCEIVDSFELKDDASARPAEA